MPWQVAHSRWRCRFLRSLPLLAYVAGKEGQSNGARNQLSAPKIAPKTRVLPSSMTAAAEAGGALGALDAAFGPADALAPGAMPIA